MKIQPFTVRTNRIDNLIYEFIFIGSKKYEVIIEVDELNDGLIVGKTCQCPDHLFRERDCKHIKKAIETLKEFVELRENETTP